MTATRLAVSLALSLVLAGSAVAQTATPPSAPPAAPTVAKAAPRQAADAGQKRACDAKWKAEKAKTKATGWKPYFVFMAACM